MSYNNNNNGGGKKSFDLSKYETVKRRKERMRSEYPDCIIYPMQLSGMHYANQFVLFLSLIWKDKKDKNSSAEVVTAVTELCKSVTPDNAAIVASSIGLLMNADSVGYSLSIAGGLQADKNAWVENCEESATGRALDNLGFHSGSASQEEMKKVEYTEAVNQQRVLLENQINGTLQSMAERNVDLNNMLNLCIQTVGKSFTYLHELAVSDLEKVLAVLQRPAA